MILLQLYFSFLIIGAVAFGGGYAILPLIQDVVVNNKGWLNMTEMADIVTISQLTPGPIAVNGASFVGTKIASLPGSFLATLGVVTPQIIMMLILGSLLFRGKKVKILDNMLKALKPGVVGLIAKATVDLIHSSIFINNFSLPLDYIALVGFGVGLVLYWKKFDIIKLIGIGACIGLILGVIEKIIL
ncbi:MAG: chromate transporter [Peptoniphilaceae bacterium]|nr:chromate transporter [Anaerococcus sp.]MDD7044266.1 chromate transporter [Peptoniphilaceae bacterium]